MGITKQVIQIRISWLRGIPKRPSTRAVKQLGFGRDSPRAAKYLAL